LRRSFVNACKNKAEVILLNRDRLTCILANTLSLYPSLTVRICDY